MTYDELSKLLQQAQPVGKKGNQVGLVLSNNVKLLFRRDVGIHAHSIGKKYPNPVDHYNIEIHIPERSGNYENFYNYHIILDHNKKLVEYFGKFEGKFLCLNRIFK
jgi:hypothetical protein